MLVAVAGAGVVERRLAASQEDHHRCQRLRREHHRPDRHHAGAGAAACREFPVRLGQGGRQRPALRRRRRQDAAQASHREIRFAARRGADLGRGAEPAGGRQNRHLALLWQQEGGGDRRRQGHLRSGHAAGLSLQRARHAGAGLLGLGQQRAERWPAGRRIAHRHRPAARRPHAADAAGGAFAGARRQRGA